MTNQGEPPLCRLDEIVEGAALERTAVVGGEPASLVVVRRDGQVAAFHNVCPHAGRPLNWAPGRFLVEDGLLICASHGASFAMPGGECVGGPCRGSRLEAVAIVEREGLVWLAPDVGAAPVAE